ncbi:hypothetical protein LTR78_001065 [Recurvomyces mirabilis]|uniref:cyclin-dependent kinase n=1 Tax=Recurvomyces mirabilis TaxID=574656 RepID=A0AAE0WX13_9PEZI|nr:hypothetical protein LTR78_001065 [Recurvomyces mirabilis]KAK5159037.1 hypothetical protein LTS14_003145 [Recurvomyces mirabilis]
MPSRWAETAEDAAEYAKRKAEKEEKKRVKAEKQQQQQRQAEEEEAQRAQARIHNNDEDAARPNKRRRLSPTQEEQNNEDSTGRPLLRSTPRTWQPCRSIYHFDLLNHIEEGSYGFVSRARENATGNIVAIKKLKLDAIRDAGFPVTALREIQCLRAAAGHRHVVGLREVVCSDSDSTDRDRDRGSGGGKGSGGGGDGRDVYLVMDFLEHDLKTLQEEMVAPFSPSEIKALLLQLTSAVDFLHDNWILHRDLKTSNILLNNRGEIKLADFGMARFVGDPAPANLTQMVVTLWYRAPELLLGAKEYGACIDVWSLGCIFGELLLKRPVLQGQNEVDQLGLIFDLCGLPSEENWPGFKRLPNARTLRLPPSSSGKGAHGPTIRSRFPALTPTGTSLLTSCLSLNPASRPTAKEILDHAYFRESPRPKPTALFPTFPSKAGQEKRRRYASPNAPIRGEAVEGTGEVDFSSVFEGKGEV